MALTMSSEAIIGTVLLALATSCSHVTFEDRFVGLSAEAEEVEPRFHAMLTNHSGRGISLPTTEFGLFRIETVRCDGRWLDPTLGAGRSEGNIFAGQKKFRKTLGSRETLEFEHRLADFFWGDHPDPAGVWFGSRQFEIHRGMKCRARFSYKLPTGRRIVSNEVAFEAR
jgi:hypothetical protein